MHSTTQTATEAHFWAPIPVMSHFHFQGIKLGKNTKTCQKLSLPPLQILLDVNLNLYYQHKLCIGMSG